MKKCLNIGCGAKIMDCSEREEWVNLDVREGLNSNVVKCDVFRTLPYQDGTFDKILAKDVLEHESYHRTDEVFKEWVRVLKKGGEITVVSPDLMTICQKYARHEIDHNKAVWLLFGGQGGGPDKCKDWQYLTHYNAMSYLRYKDMAAKAGVYLKSTGQSGGNNIEGIFEKITPGEGVR